ncbi:MAG: hypothetical protein U9N40_09040 [Euryarchaeota archaeon]|nr:hypothetical protein [Euryarchaeota archaeon]
MNFKPVLILFLLVTVITAVSAVPPLPSDYYGSVMIDGKPAEEGTVIVVKLNYNKRDDFTVTTAGQYGAFETLQKGLIVSASENEYSNSENLDVTFWSGKYQADQSDKFIPGVHKRLDLSFSTAEGPDEGIPEAEEESTFRLGNTEVKKNAEGEQEVSVNKNDPDSEVDVDEEGKAITLKNTNSGWKEITIKTKDVPGVKDGYVNGIVDSVNALGNPVKTDTLGDDVGEISGQLSLSLSEIPGSASSVKTIVTKEPAADVKSAFVLAAKSEGKEITNIAFTLNIGKTNIQNAGDGGLIENADIFMSVSSAWVDSVGRENVVIYRYSDKGDVEKLATESLGADPAISGNELFKVLSPNGLSVFMLMGVSSSSPPSPGGGGGSGSSTDESYFNYDPEMTIPVPTVSPVQTLQSGIDGEQAGSVSGEEEGSQTGNSGQEEPASSSATSGIIPVIAAFTVIAVTIAGVSYHIGSRNGGKDSETGKNKK